MRRPPLSLFDVARLTRTRIDPLDLAREIRRLATNGMKPADIAVSLHTSEDCVAEALSKRPAGARGRSAIAAPPESSAAQNASASPESPPQHNRAGAP